MLRYFPLVLNDVEHLLANLRKSASPKPQNRPLEAVKKLVHTVSVLPTATMVHVLLQRSLQRMAVVWGDAAFAKYFQKQYLADARSSQEVYGTDTMQRARWWCGAQSGVYGGHCGSQQQPEASHSQFKRCFETGKPMSMTQLVQEICSVVKRPG